jgi:hypothetical protein
VAGRGLRPSDPRGSRTGAEGWLACDPNLSVGPAAEPLIPVHTEPIMAISATVPEGSMGDVNGDGAGR